MSSSTYYFLGVFYFYAQLVLLVVFLIYVCKFFINLLKEKYNMKFGIKEYWKPTPKKVRKFADSLSAAALAVSAYTFMTDYKAVSYVVLASAFVGKFLSNLFADDEEVKSNSL